MDTDLQTIAPDDLAMTRGDTPPLYVTSESGHAKVDFVASVMQSAMESGAMTPVSMEPESTFAPGLYIRKVVMRAGEMWISKIHLERHPYFVMRGHAKVWIDSTGWVDVVAPYSGITEPGTRRILWMIEDTEWITVHHNPDNTEDLEKIEARIIEARELPPALPENVFNDFLSTIQQGELK